ncbi:MAG: hypothetical protein NTV79_00210, partial [Candidatus Aureabacteria bacterium]|nr:hypothetical protein [Candidatus Auribacterota bacterium]
MSLFDNILSWATAELKGWQRDALRRLFIKQDLDQQDYDDLYAMLKSAHGLPDPQNRQPFPIAEKHLPAQVGGAAPIVLCALRDLKHVNRIASGQKLEFAPNGITVVYGGNASGKSGYSRVLKRACRARDLAEIIHPDAFDAKAAANVPEATFDIGVKENEKITLLDPLTWKLGETPPDELSTISVFDNRCARAYLDSEQDAAGFNRTALSILHRGLPYSRQGTLILRTAVYSYFVAGCYAVGGVRLLPILVAQAILSGMT